MLRHLSPVVVVDESHNAGSDLSVEMLNNLNPSFVLDLTATPRKNSNIISYVDARELKKENMVKLPVIVYNRNNQHSVINDALRLRNQIEKQAAAGEQNGGAYIRPIILFQAESNTGDEDRGTYDKIRDMLVDMGIPEDEIGIKTSKIDTIRKQNLMSRDCKIRYIITVNALKEGWDCPFAYILASLANKTSTVEVEQILGRILRQPYARQHSGGLLNSSYVLTCSRDFHATLDKIVAGLNKAGFSCKDFRLGGGENEPPQMPPEPFTQAELTQNPAAPDAGTFDDVRTQDIKAALEADENSMDAEIAAMIQQAEHQAQQYRSEVEQSGDSGFIGGELGDMLNQNEIQAQFRKEVQAVRIPQFFLQSTPDLFGDAYELLEPENLSAGFSLRGQDAQMSFELATGEMYTVDIQEEGEAVPKYKRTAKNESEYIREFLATLPPERKIAQCTKMMVTSLNRNNRYAAAELEDYVRRVVSGMTADELSVMETAIPIYAKKIQRKIETLENAYTENQFYKWLDSGKVVCRESYSLPPVITPAYTIDSIPLSLYEAERDDMNGFERQLIDVIVSQENIRWWHRIIDRRGFRINGFINHYPDFMVMTKSSRLILVEAKGDYLDGDDSKTKLKLGRRWQAQAGSDYRYFMVFKDKDLGLDGAYTIDSFVDVIKNL